MIRFGSYARYRGVDYRLGEHENATVQLVSKDPSSVSLGFQQTPYGTYLKTVPRSDVEEMYSVRTYASYRGRKFFVISERGGQLELAGELVDTDLGFANTGHGEWSKLVTPEELERIWEERRSL